jgi:hypothetical protein
MAARIEDLPDRVRERAEKSRPRMTAVAAVIDEVQCVGRLHQFLFIEVPFRSKLGVS